MLFQQASSFISFVYIGVAGGLAMCIFVLRALTVVPAFWMSGLLGKAHAYTYNSSDMDLNISLFLLSNLS